MPLRAHAAASCPFPAPGMKTAPWQLSHFYPSQKSVSPAWASGQGSRSSCPSHPHLLHPPSAFLDCCQSIGGLPDLGTSSSALLKPDSGPSPPCPPRTSPRLSHQQQLPVTLPVSRLCSHPSASRSDSSRYSTNLSQGQGHQAPFRSRALQEASSAAREEAGQTPPAPITLLSHGGLPPPRQKAWAPHRDGQGRGGGDLDHSGSAKGPAEGFSLGLSIPLSVDKGLSNTEEGCGVGRAMEYKGTRGGSDIPSAASLQEAFSEGNTISVYNVLRLLCYLNFPVYAACSTMNMLL